MLADTHCHLYLDAFQEDMQAVLDRAWERGIDRILIPGIDLETSRQAVKLAEGHPNLYAAAGVHPNDALSWNSDTLKELKRLAEHPKVVAIGEIGLDFYWDHAPHPLQGQILRHQLDLAAELLLPVVIHSRSSIADLWPVLRDWQIELAESHSPLAFHPGVLHSFEGDLETGLEAAAHHFFIGISGPVTFRNARDRQQIVAGLPQNCLLVETDAPYLTPHPHRGKRNEPAYVSLVAEKVAELHHLELSTISQLTNQNAGRLFGWGESF